jgi:hypothetical protein
MKAQESKNTTQRLLQLVLRAKEPQFISTVFELKSVKNAIVASKANKDYVVLTAIATHRVTPKKVLKELVHASDSNVKTLIAMRDDCDKDMQNLLFKDGDAEVLLALSHNPKLEKNIAYKLINNSEYARFIAKYIQLDKDLFELLFKDYSLELAKNETMTHDMQECLFSLHKNDVQIALASNTHIDEGIVTELISEGSPDISLEIYANSATPIESLEEAFENKANYTALARNEKTPLYILNLLASSEDEKVLMGLARNIATPLEVLQQLYKDLRFQAAVQSNKAFKVRAV